MIDFQGKISVNTVNAGQHIFVDMIKNMLSWLSQVSENKSPQTATQMRINIMAC